MDFIFDPISAIPSVEHSRLAHVTTPTHEHGERVATLGSRAATLVAARATHTRGSAGIADATVSMHKINDAHTATTINK